MFETLTIPSTSILYVNVYNFTFKTYSLTIEVLKLGRNSGLENYTQNALEIHIYYTLDIKHITLMI